MKTLALGISINLLAWSAYGQGNVVTDWAAIVQPAINNAAAPRPPASSEVLHTMVALAVYDAVMAVEGGYQPYALAMQAPAGADVRAAVATAAHKTSRMRVAASQVAYLDMQYAYYMISVPDGSAKTAGIQVGEAAANAILAARADSSRQCGALRHNSNHSPGEFEPNAGCGTSPWMPSYASKPFTSGDPPVPARWTRR
jgi:hypothetical protein